MFGVALFNCSSVVINKAFNNLLHLFTSVSACDNIVGTSSLQTLVAIGETNQPVPVLSANKLVSFGIEPS